MTHPVREFPKQLRIDDPTLRPVKDIFSSLNRKLPSPSTLIRWRVYGKRGVKLPAKDVGGSWHTTLEAVQWFFDEVSDLRNEACRSQKSDDVTSEELASVGL